MVRRLRADEWSALRAIRLRALAESPEAFSAQLSVEEGYPETLWQSRAADSAAGERAATFVSIGEGGAWNGLVTVLGPSHEARDGVSAELVSMWVAPEARGAGVARALAQEALAFARKSGAPCIRLAVTRGNRAASRLYEQFGFVKDAAENYAVGHPCRGEDQYVLVF